MTRYTPIIPKKDDDHVEDICLYCTLRNRASYYGVGIAFAVFFAAVAVYAATKGDIEGVAVNVIVAAFFWYSSWKDHDLIQRLKAMNRSELHPPYSKGEPGVWAEEQRDHAISMLIERWHNLGGQDHTAFSLPTWLGWSHEEYAHWVETNEPPIPSD